MAAAETEKADWWVYRKTAKVAHAISLTGTKRVTSGRETYLHDGVALCGMQMWIYSKPESESDNPIGLKHCPKCEKALKEVTDAE